MILVGKADPWTWVLPIILFAIVVVGSYMSQRRPSQVATENNVQETHLLLTTALQHLPEFILVTTDMESHLGVNGDVLGVTGYTADEFLALDPMGDFLSPNADRAQVTASYESVVARAQPLLEVDTPYIHKDGRTIWLRLCHGSRVVGTAPSGKAKVLAVLRDVTSEVVAVRSERARRVELLPDMIYKMVVDEATGRRHFAHSSPQALSMCGLTAAEMTSGFFTWGSSFSTTASIRGRRCSFSLTSTVAHRSTSCRSIR